MLHLRHQLEDIVEVPPPQGTFDGWEKKKTARTQVRGVGRMGHILPVGQGLVSDCIHTSMRGGVIIM